MTQLSLFAELEPEPVSPSDDRPWLTSPLTSADYDPGHPWYYLLGGVPLEPDAIEPARCEGMESKLPKNPARAREELDRRLGEARQSLADAIARYQDIRARGAEALSHYDRTISSGGRDDMAVATALSLTASHVSWFKGRIVELQSLIAGSTNPTRSSE